MLKINNENIIKVYIGSTPLSNIYVNDYIVMSSTIDLSLYKFTTWQPTTNIDGTREIVNEGSANNLTLYSGSGTSFNGVNQYVAPLTYSESLFLRDSFTLSFIKDVDGDSGYLIWLGSIDVRLVGDRIRVWGGASNEVIYGYEASLITIAYVKDTTTWFIYKNGVLLDTIVATPSIQANGLTIGNRPNVGYGGGTLKDLYIHNRALTQTEITKNYEQPEQFYIDALADDTCVLNMPLNDKGSTAHDYVSNTDYPKLNYTADQNISNLQYGTQDLKLPHDDLGLRDGTITSYIKCDGVSYADTGWVSPLDTEGEAIEIIFTEPSIVQDYYNKIFSQTGYSATSVLEIAKGTAVSLTTRYRGLTLASKVISGPTMVTLVASSDTSYIYFNGSLSLSGPKVAYTTTQSLLLGAFSLGTLGVQNINGVSIRLFKVYNKALTQEEVTENYNDAVNKGLLNE